jgi:hypothetical protein
VSSIAPYNLDKPAVQKVASSDDSEAYPKEVPKGPAPFG